MIWHGKARLVAQDFSRRASVWSCNGWEFLAFLAGVILCYYFFVLRRKRRGD